MTIDQMLMSVKQVAAILSISKGTVYKMVNTGEIASVSVGTRKLIPREAVETLIRSHAAVARSNQAIDGAIRVRNDATAALMRAASAVQAAAEALRGNHA